MLDVFYFMKIKRSNMVNIITSIFLFLPLCYLLLLFYFSMLLEIGINEGNIYTSLLIVIMLCLFLLHIASAKLKVENQILTFWIAWIYIITTVCFPINLIIDSSLMSNKILTNLRIAVLPATCFISLFILFKESTLSRKIISYSYICFWLIASFLFFIFFSIISELRPDKPGLAHGYYLLLSLPACFLCKMKYIKITLYLITLIVLIVSGKRGGVLAIILTYFTYYIFELLFSKNNKIQNIFRILFVFAVFFSILIAIIQFSENEYIIYFKERFSSISEDGGSGRDRIYQLVLNEFFHSSFIQMLFGNGVDGVLNNPQIGISAHNDFLEILYDYGIFVFLMFVYLNYLLLKKIYSLIKGDSEYAYAFSFSYTIFFVLSMISHVVIYPYFLLLLPFWAYIYSKT